MSFYTTQLRTLVNNGYDLGLKDYPIFDESYRAVLNQKIIDHYYMREIGAETPELFTFYLNRKMREIMPYYNQLYESAKIEYDPLVNNITTIHHVKHNDDKTEDNHTGEAFTEDDGTYSRDRTQTDDGTRHETFDENVDQTTHTDGNTFSESRGINSDTPQQQIGLKGIVYDALYATGANTNQSEGASVTDETLNRKTDHTLDETTHLTTKEDIGDKSHSTQDYNDSWKNTHNGDHWEDFVQTNDGLVSHSQPELIMQYRETFLNIDMLVIEELAPLFMMLYQ